MLLQYYENDNLCNVRIKSIKDENLKVTLLYPSGMKRKIGQSQVCYYSHKRHINVAFYPINLRYANKNYRYCVFAAKMLCKRKLSRSPL